MGSKVRVRACRVLRDFAFALAARRPSPPVPSRTGLLPQEARELSSTFSRDLPRQQAPFCRGPASVSNGKISPQKNRKKSRGRKIDLLPLEKSLFCRRKHADFTARAARFFRKFWPSSGAKGRDSSLGFNSSEKTEGTLPEELDRAEAIPGGHATSK